MHVVDGAGNIVKNKYEGIIYSDEYARKFHAALNGMVEKQMKKSNWCDNQFLIHQLGKRGKTAWFGIRKRILIQLEHEINRKG